MDAFLATMQQVLDYLHTIKITDLIDIAMFKSGMGGVLTPWMIVLFRFALALPLSFAVAVALSRLKPLAWTIGLGPTPWQMRKANKKAGA